MGPLMFAVRAASARPGSALHRRAPARGATHASRNPAFRPASAEFWRLGAGVALCIAALPVAANALSECRLPGLQQAVLCGALQRPLDLAQPGGKAIDVQYVVLPAKARKKLPDPVFFLAGGPGQSAVDFADPIRQMLGRLNHRRDIVLVDQRGTGRSTPLKCAEVSGASEYLVTEVEQILPLLRACRARLVKELSLTSEADLARFGTTAAMADLDAVRAELGYQTINLVGVSYGTRAALEYLRLYPQRARRVLLDGVAPADMGLIDSMGEDQQAAFDAMLKACAASAECAKDYPRLTADWRALLASLPRDTKLADPLTGKWESLRMTRTLVLGAVAGSLYVPSMAAALPEAITRAAAGEFTALAGLAARAETQQESIALGMHFGVVCSEDYPRLRTPAPARELGAPLRDLYAKVCAEWPADPAPVEYYGVGSSPVPTLLLGGGSDPATPPRHQQRVAQALGTQARSLVAPALGHNVLGSACGVDLAYAFIDAKTSEQALKLDDECLKRIPPPPAFVPLKGKAK